MSRRYKLILIASLIVAIIMFFTFVSSGVLAKSSFIIGKNFDNHTYVGPFNISNNKIERDKSKLSSDFSELQSKLEVNLIYQDIQFSLLPETVTFDIEMNLANANSGEDNPIVANVSREGLKTVLTQQLPSIQFTEEGVESIAEGVEKELQTGIMPRNVHITDYIANEIPNEVVASSEYSTDSISLALSKAIHALDGVVIQPHASFSIKKLLTSAEVGLLTDEEMTLLSSTLYATILQTNFQIDERNISTSLASNIQPGFEAAMNQTLALDFKFTNPNKTEFAMQAAWSNGAIHLSIEGMPFYYTYEPTTTTINTYKPRTIRQYSAFVNDGQVLVSEDGKEGMEVVVQRNISYNGKLINTEDISKDFYAPVHRIEMYPLTRADSSTGESTSGSDNVRDENGTEQFEEGESGTESDSSADNGSGSSTASNKTETDSQNEGKQIYDKSGLPIGGK